MDRSRLLTGLYLFGVGSFVWIAEYAVEFSTGLPAVGGLLAAAISSVVTVVIRTPVERAADRRTELLEGQVAEAKREASELRTLRRMGGLRGSRYDR